jgi:hypothetical protein
MTESKKNNWEVLGRFLAIVVELFTDIKKCLTDMGVGLEILDWLRGEGKAMMLDFVQQLGRAHLKHYRMTVPKIVKAIHLDGSDGIEITHHVTSDGVDVFIDGRRMIAETIGILCSQGKASSEMLDGRTTFTEFTPLTANFADFFVNNPEYWPQNLKSGEPPCIFVERSLTFPIGTRAACWWESRTNKVRTTIVDLKRGHNLGVYILGF